MTDIATVPGIDNEKLTRVARSLIKDDNGTLKMIKAFQVVVDDEPVMLSFDELEGLINILDTYRPLKARLEPSQWVILTYQLNDLEQFLKEDWRIVKYSLHVNARTKTLKFSGSIQHIWSIQEHPEFGKGPLRGAKEFEFTLGDFEIIQQMALSRVIALRGPEYEPVAGTIDVSYLYKFGPEGISFATLNS